MTPRIPGTVFTYATGYPRNHALLEREMDKLLSAPGRRENIKKINDYLKQYVERAPVRAARKRKPRTKRVAKTKAKR